ncbi:deoxyribose-phosphate aldolase [Salegentibacter salarius]|uniref:Deoxyribose-phosphate aldolase n=1 Tax=Salegentibacter salarius TaxID=435906 RepID=A0A2N0U326_9FLAO|nr:deoxyribose-phosphate aldolase [Salegentibacter salarius]OEY71241.1 deoxyribose-phosphate aldolase [Salegentibacter salarius]PKD21395.1 2-deoxyribose-5-phosphate aldolase [Salegentibacter salarius]SLJ92855.1 deoxyribose-phosphate aldolase [Salegentibacter salarius]
MQLNQFIDHTLLKPTATPEDIENLCKEAIAHQFIAVCIPPSYLKHAKSVLKDSNVKLATVTGFPLGAMTTEAKVFEAKDAIVNGADEIDMVINIGMLKGGDANYIENEIAEIKKAIGSKILKVIIETCYLTDAEKEAACKAALNANADFVKTSTGFGTGGATFEDVKLMKKIAGDKMQIKASGGIKDRETAIKYIELGVSRLGTSSGIKLVTSEEN